MFMESSSSVFMLLLSFVISNLAHYFIRSLIRSVFTYNSELWCNSADKKQINRITGLRNNGILTLIWIFIYEPR